MYRFVNNCRLQKYERVIGPLTPDERSTSLRFFIRSAQLRAYSSEMKAVSDSELLPAGSSLAKLRPQLSGDGDWRRR